LHFLTGMLGLGQVEGQALSHQRAGSTSPGPGALPDHGTVKYRGTTYGVSSFAAATGAGQARIYLLVHP